MCDAEKANVTDGISKSNIILAKDIPETSSSNFMLSVWFYIDNWGNNISKEKNILYMATQQNAKTNESLKDALSGISKKVFIADTLTTGTPEVKAAAAIARAGLYKNINIAVNPTIPISAKYPSFNVIKNQLKSVILFTGHIYK